VVLDFSMKRMDGEEVAKALKQQCPTVPIILYSGCQDIPERVFDFVDAFASKGDGWGFLVATIRAVLKKKKPPTPERRLDRTG